MALLAVIPIGSMVRDFARPAKCDDDLRFRDFARWFWPEASRDAELVVLDADATTRFVPEAFEWDFSSQYLCLQRIYTPRPARTTDISAGHPLRCVRYRASGYPDDASVLRSWLDRMKLRYDLAACREHRISRTLPHMREPQEIGCVVVYEFVPKKAMRLAGE
jgi:hypothetical protein